MVFPGAPPDLAIHKFARLMLQDRPIPVYGDGSSSRDYTFVADVIDAVVRAAEYSATPYEIINVGNTHPVSLLELIRRLESAIGITARVDPRPPMAGDVPRTHADCAKAHALLGYRPKTEMETGVGSFVRWLGKSTDNGSVARQPPPRSASCMSAGDA